MGAFSLLRFSAQSEGSGAGPPALGPAADRHEPDDLGPVGEPLGAGSPPLQEGGDTGYFDPGTVGGRVTVHPRRSGSARHRAVYVSSRESAKSASQMGAPGRRHAGHKHLPPSPQPLHSPRTMPSSRGRSTSSLIDSLPSLGTAILCPLQSGRMKNQWLVVLVHVPWTATVMCVHWPSGSPLLRMDSVGPGLREGAKPSLRSQARAHSVARRDSHRRGATATVPPANATAFALWPFATIDRGPRGPVFPLGLGEGRQGRAAGEAGGSSPRWVLPLHPDGSSAQPRPQMDAVPTPRRALKMGGCVLRH